MRFIHFISAYIAFFLVNLILFALVRPPSLMRYVRDMTGAPELNITNLPIARASGGGDVKNQRRSSSVAVASVGDDGALRSADAEDEETAAVSSSSSTLSSSSSSSSTPSKDLPAPTLIPAGEVNYYKKYFHDRLTSKIRMTCPWNLLIDYTFAYMIVDDLGLKYAPGVDANLISLLHPCFAVACVYFLVTSVKEVPINNNNNSNIIHHNSATTSCEMRTDLFESATRTTCGVADDQQQQQQHHHQHRQHQPQHQHQPQQGEITPRDELALIMEKSRKGSYNHEAESDSNQLKTHEPSIGTIASPSSLVGSNQNMNSAIPVVITSGLSTIVHSSPLSSSASVSHFRTHSRVLSTAAASSLAGTLKQEGLSKRKNNSTLELGAGAGAVTGGGGGSDNLDSSIANLILSGKDDVGVMVLQHQTTTTTTAATTPSPSSTTAMMSASNHNNINTMNTNDNTNNCISNSSNTINSIVGTNSNSSPVHLDSVPLSPSHHHHHNHHHQQRREDWSSMNDDFEGEFHSTAEGAAGNVSTKIVQDVWRLKMGAICLFLRNFIDNVDGVMARQQRKLGLHKSGFLKDVDGHTIDATADTVGAGMCFLACVYVLCRRRVVLSPPIARFLSRLGVSFHRRNPIVAGRIVAFVGIPIAIGVVGAFWDTFVTKYSLLFEPFVVSYAADLVPLEQSLAVRLSMYMWSCVCGDALLLLVVSAIYFNLLWETAQYLFFFYWPCMIAICIHSFFVWNTVVLKNPIAQVLEQVETNFKL